MKRLILIIPFYFIFQIYSYDYDSFEIDNIIGNVVKIDTSYHPGFRKQLNGRGFILSNISEIIYKYKKIDLRVIRKINYEIVPYSKEGVFILKSIFSDYDDLFSERRIYFDDRNVDRPFSYDYIAKGPRYLSEYEPDIIVGQDGTHIERDFSYGCWFYSGPEDRLTYYFRDNIGLFSEYVIEFYGIWQAFGLEHDYSLLIPKLQNFQPPDGGEYIDVLYTLTNEELDAYPDQSDPSIQLMHLLNEAMENFRFKDRPNAPPANLATVNDSLVRLRSEPTLSGEVLGHVNTNEEVIVMEQSPVEQTIGGQTSRWYKVVSKTSYLKGWMFGSFLDFKTSP